MALLSQLSDEMMLSTTEQVVNRRRTCHLLLHLFIVPVHELVEKRLRLYSKDGSETQVTYASSILTFDEHDEPCTRSPRWQVRNYET